MRQEDVISALREIGGRASMSQIKDHVKQLRKEKWDNTKLADRLVSLSRRGLVKKEGETWILIDQGKASEVEEHEHVIRYWEKRHARIALGKYAAFKKPFTLFIDGKPYYGRCVDSQGRVWLGVHALEDYKEGDKIRIKVSRENVYITRE